MARSRHRISTHFAVEEFDSHDGKRVPAGKLSALQHLADWWLEPLREEFGPVTVRSGYRSMQQNSDVGGARHSVHLLTTEMSGTRAGTHTFAAAADVVCQRGGVTDWADWAHTHRDHYPHLATRGRGGIGFYPVAGFVHLDTAGLRDWTG